jgi:hypothetical protein
MAGLINLRLLTDFFNKIGHKPPELDELPSDSLFVAKPYTAERMIAAVSELH